MLPTLSWRSRNRSKELPSRDKTIRVGSEIWTRCSDNQLTQEHNIGESTADEHEADAAGGGSKRVAVRLRAGAVSSEYVTEAAFTIRIRRSSGGVADVLLAIGICLLGLAGGVLAVVLTATASTHLKLGWVSPAAIGRACAGFLLSGIGGTMKIRLA